MFIYSLESTSPTIIPNINVIRELHDMVILMTVDGSSKDCEHTVSHNMSE